MGYGCGVVTADRIVPAVGVVGLAWAGPASAELAFLLKVGYWGRGYAAEAGEEVVAGVGEPVTLVLIGRQFSIGGTMFHTNSIAVP